MTLKRLIPGMIASILTVCFLFAALGEDTSSQDSITTSGEALSSFDYLPIPPSPVPGYHSSGSSASLKVTETLVKYTPATGTGYTNVSWVNVRETYSTKAARVTYLRSSGIYVTIMGEVLNSAGEIWYIVRLANGTVGYILSTFVNAEIEYLAEEESAGGSAGDQTVVQYVYITPEPTAEPAPETTAAPVAGITPQVIYLNMDPLPYATPTPIIVYVTPGPAIEENEYGYDYEYEYEEDMLDGEPVNG